MNPDQIIGQIRLESEAVVAVLIFVGILLIWFVNRKRILLRWREWRTQRSLSRIGSEQIRNLVCPDGLDGHYNIDRLALVQDAILVISYRPYSGNIYCAERIAEWTQVVGQKSFKFENPLFELENQLTSLRLLTGQVAVYGYLFFNHSAEFPKGHPASVLHPDNIPGHFLHENSAPANAETLAAWESLKNRPYESQSSNQLRVKT